MVLRRLCKSLLVVIATESVKCENMVIEGDHMSPEELVLDMQAEILSVVQQYGAENVRYFIRKVDNNAETCFIVHFAEPNLLRRIGLQQALSDLLRESVYFYTQESLRDEVRDMVLERCQQL